MKTYLGVCGLYEIRNLIAGIMNSSPSGIVKGTVVMLRDIFFHNID